MRVQVHLDQRTYDVEVDVLSDGQAVPPKEPEPAFEIPAAVLRKRPPQKLPEDRFGRCPIAGRVARITATAGQIVHKNEPVMIIEAMKMETGVGPAVDGVVKAIHVVAGEAVKSGQILFELD